MDQWEICDATLRHLYRLYGESSGVSLGPSSGVAIYDR